MVRTLFNILSFFNWTTANTAVAIRNQGTQSNSERSAQAS